MTSPAKPVRVRSAPSPKENPHVGTTYIALSNYVFSRLQAGKFVFRTDSAQMNFDALHRIGLT